jgi:hypothetical protein
VPRAWAALACVFRLLASSVHSFEPLNRCFTFSKSGLTPLNLFFLPPLLRASYYDSSNSVPKLDVPRSTMGFMAGGIWDRVPNRSSPLLPLSSSFSKLKFLLLFQPNRASNHGRLGQLDNTATQLMFSGQHRRNLQSVYLVLSAELIGLHKESIFLI